MTFLTVLTKELRLAYRRERTIWLLIVYVCLLSLFGYLLLQSSMHGNSLNNIDFSKVGMNLYVLLITIQLALIIILTPAFTANTINSERERQTLDLLLCARISSYSLILAKLVASITHILAMIVATLPLFSIVFFFGGIGPIHILTAFVVSICTTIFMGAISIFCSVLIQKQAGSIVAAYMICCIWLLSAPLSSLVQDLNNPQPNSIISYSTIKVVNNSTNMASPGQDSSQSSTTSTFLQQINPWLALYDTTPLTHIYDTSIPFSLLTGFKHTDNIIMPTTTVSGSAGKTAFSIVPAQERDLGYIQLGSIALPIWSMYVSFSLLASAIFFLLSSWILKPQRSLWLAKGSQKSSSTTSEQTSEDQDASLASSTL